MESVEEYFNYTRKEIAPLIPQKVDRVLEIGCGAGKTLSWLKDHKGCTWTCGVEISPAAEQAGKILDEIYAGNIECVDLPIEKNSLDLILCLDVLEHTIDPWQVMKKLYEFLKPGGAIIVSLPNIRNKRVIIPLLFKGKFEYQEAGILDRTHLRFFVRDSAIQLVKSAGFDVDMVLSTGLRLNRKSQRVFCKLLPDFIRSFFDYQYIVRGIKAG
jgi:2-polyprenyl-3-methyl-5-hydroxy-6-metoxy-1,4-benzoquinol methylase